VATKRVPRERCHQDYTFYLVYRSTI